MQAKRIDETKTRKDSSPSSSSIDEVTMIDSCFLRYFLNSSLLDVRSYGKILYTTSRRDLTTY